MSELLSSGFGGDDFATRSVGSGLAAIGSSTIVTVVPPADQRVKLTMLEIVGVTAFQTGISVTFGAVNVFTGNLGHGLTPGSSTEALALTVGHIPQGDASFSASGAKRSLIGKLGETLTIVKTSGTTIHAIAYGYEVGE